ncbi:MULE domain-containing protein, partial [Trichostrongylus colubriformis]
SIVTRKKIGPSKKDENDIESVKMRDREEDADVGIKVYTPAISKTGGGFTSVVIRPLQQSWIAKYGARSVFVDDTFNLTAYSLRLATMIVVDEEIKAYRCILWSNRMTDKEVALMLYKTKTLVPNPDTEYLIWDD